MLSSEAFPPTDCACAQAMSFRNKERIFLVALTTHQWQFKTSLRNFGRFFHPRPSSDIIRLSVLKLQAKVPTTKLCWLLPGLRTSLRFHSFRERNIYIACYLLWKLFALHIPMPRQGFSLVSESYTVVVWTVRRQSCSHHAEPKKGIEFAFIPESRFLRQEQKRLEKAAANIQHLNFKDTCYVHR